MQIVWITTKSLTQLIDELLAIQCGMNDLRNLSVRAGRSSNVFALRNLSVMLRSRISGNGNADKNHS